MNDDKILRMGGNEDDIKQYAHKNGADLTEVDFADIITRHEFQHGCFQSCQNNHDEFTCEYLDDDYKRCAKLKRYHLL